MLAIHNSAVSPCLNYVISENVNFERCEFSHEAKIVASQFCSQRKCFFFSFSELLTCSDLWKEDLEHNKIIELDNFSKSIYICKQFDLKQFIKCN